MAVYWTIKHLDRNEFPKSHKGSNKTATSSNNQDKHRYPYFLITELFSSK